MFFFELEYASGTTYFRESEAKLQYACMMKVFCMVHTMEIHKKKFWGTIIAGCTHALSSCAYKLLLVVLG